MGMILQSGPSHLGDIVWCLTALRRIPGPHILFTPAEYQPQLLDLCEHRLIELAPLEQALPDAKCTWIGCGRFTAQGLTWRNDIDVVDFLMKWSNLMCVENGIAPQFIHRQDMLADWPAIQRHAEAPEFDVLVINALPLSGQIPRYDNVEMNALIEELAAKYRVIVTNPTPAKGAIPFSGTLSQIANLGLRSKFVVANATGPSWGLHNVWSQSIPTYLMVDPYKLDYSRPMPCHGLVRDGMRWQLQQDGWL
jgi:hypothetical protein